MQRIAIYSIIALLTFTLGTLATLLSPNSPNPRPSLTHLQQPILAAKPVVKEQGCPPDLIAITQTIEELRKIKTNVVDTHIPYPAKPLLIRLKHQLREFINEALNAQGAQQRVPQQLQESILAQLQQAGVLVEEPAEPTDYKQYLDSDYTYGNVEKISIQQVANHPDLVAATTTIGICCGEDTSLYLFRKRAGHWELVLAQETNNYDEVSGGQGMYQLGISPPSQGNDFFVVAANVNPWCTSNWQSLRYMVLRPGYSPDHPQVILSKSETIYIATEGPYKLDVKQGSFSLSFEGEGNPDEVTRQRLVRYQVRGDNTKAISR